MIHILQTSLRPVSIYQYFDSEDIMEMLKVLLFLTSKDTQSSNLANNYGLLIPRVTVKKFTNNSTV